MGNASECMRWRLVVCAVCGLQGCGSGLRARQEQEGAKGGGGVGRGGRRAGGFGSRRRRWPAVHGLRALLSPLRVFLPAARQSTLEGRWRGCGRERGGGGPRGRHGLSSHSKQRTPCGRDGKGARE